MEQTVRWIPVEEEMPAIGDAVLVCQSGSPRAKLAWWRGPAIGAVRRRGDWNSWAGIFSGVTHWMPLPRVP